MNSIAEEVTKLLLQKLEQGIVPWKRPWSLTSEGGRPLRHEGTPYTGINCPWLWSIADSRGYKSRYWMTKRQAEELGGRVRKGAEATISIYASTFRKQGKSLLTGETTAQLIRFLRSYLVYNADEIDGLPAWYYPRPVAPTPTLLSLRQEAIDAFFEQIPSVVRYGGSEAYFSPLSDHIQMPKLAHFASADLFASTLAHEHVHWTGARSRLDRTFGKRFGDKAYAFEELVACLGQSFICAELGLPTELSRHMDPCPEGRQGRGLPRLHQGRAGGQIPTSLCLGDACRQGRLTEERHMGWLEMSRTAMGGHETPKAYLDAQFTYEREVDGAKRGHKVLASSCVNNRVWYGAVQQVENGVPGEVFAVVCLVKWNPRSRSGYHFAYKDMDESVGPYEAECPERILDLLTETDRPHAMDWRARCRAAIASRRRDVPDGALVRFESPLTCSDDRQETDFRVRKDGAKLRFFRLDGNGPYRVRHFYKLKWSIVPETKVHRTVLARAGEPTKDMLKCA